MEIYSVDISLLALSMIDVISVSVTVVVLSSSQPELITVGAELNDGRDVSLGGIPQLPYPLWHPDPQ